MGDLPTFVETVFANESLAASGSITSGKFKMNDYKPRKDKLGFQVHSAGASSVLKLEFLESNDDVTYIPNGTDIKTDHAPGDGFYEFTPSICKFFKIRATETSGANPITDLDVKMAIR